MALIWTSSSSWAVKYSRRSNTLSLMTIWETRGGHPDGKLQHAIMEVAHITYGGNAVRVFYLVGPFKLLLVKVKVPTKSADCEERAQQCGLVRHQRGAVWILLVLSLQPGQSSWKTGEMEPVNMWISMYVQKHSRRRTKVLSSSIPTIETVETGPDKLVVVCDFVDDGA